jgi:hypothetical protein
MTQTSSRPDAPHGAGQPGGENHALKADGVSAAGSIVMAVAGSAPA